MSVLPLPHSPPFPGIASLPAHLVPRADQACDGFEAAWKLGSQPRVEDYLGGLPEEERPALLRELVALEVDYRRLAGEEPAPEEYARRFPSLDAAWLAPLFPARLPGGSSPGVGTPRNPGAAEAPGAEGGRLGKFQLLECVGAGAFGQVWRARDTDLDRVIALKLPHAHLVAAAEVRARFFREVRALARLRHPGIVTIHEVATLGGSPALISDFVEGPTLRELLAVRQPSQAEAGRLVAAVADALEYAHGMGVVHRDVKPANIMLASPAPGAPDPTGLGQPLLVDFGLALREEAELTLTLDGEVVGTPAYMSPEQAAGRGHRVDRRTDVYSLGVILYQLLTGELPFRGSRANILLQVLGEDPRPPRRVNHRIPAALEVVCLKAMAKEAHRRYGSAGALAADLRRFLAGEPVSARPPWAWERTFYRVKRRPVLAALLLSTAVAALSLVGLVVAAYYGGRLEEAVRQTSAQRQQAETNLYFHRLVLAAHEWSDSNVGRAEKLLEECPAGLRGWEWRYLKQLCHCDLLTIEHNPSGVKSHSVVATAYSPVGDRLYSASRDGTVKCWDAVSGRDLGLVGWHEEGALAVTCSPDGRWVASGGQDGFVSLWDARTGRQLHHLPAHRDGSVYCLAFSPDSLRLASGSGCPPWERFGDETSRAEVKLWDVPTGRELRVLRGHSNDVLALAFHPGGRLLASAAGAWIAQDGRKMSGELRVWDTATGALAWSPSEPCPPLTGVAYSPDGQRLAASGWDHTVRLWEVPAGQPARVLRGHRDRVRGVAFSPDGQTLASAGSDGAVKVWHAAAGKEILTLRGHTQAVTCVAFHPSGRRLVSGSSDQTLKVWNPRREQEALTYRGHRGPVACLVFDPEGRHLLSADNRVGEEGKVFPEIRVWEAETGRDVRAWQGHQGPVFAMDLTRDGRRLATGGMDQTIVLWDWKAARQVQTLASPSAAVRALAFAPDGKSLLATCQNMDFPAPGDKPARALVEIMLWDAQTGCLLETVGRTDKSVIRRGVAFSPDGRWAAGVSDAGLLRVWELPSFRRVLSIPAHPRVITAVAYSPDGSRLATASWDQTVKVWDAASGREEFTLEGHVRYVLCVAFSPDGSRLATGSEDQTVKLWDVRTGQETLTLRGHTDAVTGVAFSPDGQCLASASKDGTVKVWSTRPADPPAEAEGR